MSQETAKPTPENTEKTKMNRREFLNLAWLASLGFMTLSLGGVTYFFAMPRFQEGEFGGTFDVGSVAELPDILASPGNFPKGKFWLSNSEEGLSALYKVCTHLGCLYSWRDQEYKFVCPCHGSQFQKDGIYIQGPAPRSLDQFVVQIVEAGTGTVIVETPLEGGPVQVPDNPDARILVNTGKRIKGQSKS